MSKFPKGISRLHPINSTRDGSKEVHLVLLNTCIFAWVLWVPLILALHISFLLPIDLFTCSQLSISWSHQSSLSFSLKTKYIFPFSFSFFHFFLITRNLCMRQRWFFLLSLLSLLILHIWFFKLNQITFSPFHLSCKL